MKDFSKIITQWYTENSRDLPWRNTRNPYKIWLSEIILQQTRVDQGMSYYLKFESKFESVKDLANASEDEILSMWQGLGYYSRGRNLLKAAQQVVNEYNGEFPTSYKELIKLKGIGDYSASAIASFSSDEQVAVLDGNVFRVLSRFFLISTPIDTGAGKKEFKALAQELLPKGPTATHNQAIMEFGALMCTPKKPNCDLCPLQTNCEAYHKGEIFNLPIKSKKIKKKERFLNFFLIEQKSKIAFQKRDDQGIWANMYQLPLIETDQVGIKFGKPLWETKHILTHQNLHCRFYKTDEVNFGNLIWVEKSDIKNHALPRVIDLFFEFINQ